MSRSSSVFSPTSSRSSNLSAYSPVSVGVCESDVFHFGKLTFNGEWELPIAEILNGEARNKRIRKSIKENLESNKHKKTELLKKAGFSLAEDRNISFQFNEHSFASLMELFKNSQEKDEVKKTFYAQLMVANKNGNPLYRATGLLLLSTLKATKYAEKIYLYIEAARLDESPDRFLYYNNIKYSCDEAALLDIKINIKKITRDMALQIYKELQDIDQADSEKVKAIIRRLIKEKEEQSEAERQLASPLHSPQPVPSDSFASGSCGPRRTNPRQGMPSLKIDIAACRTIPQAARSLRIDPSCGMLRSASVTAQPAVVEPVRTLRIDPDASPISAVSLEPSPKEEVTPETDMINSLIKYRFARAKKYRFKDFFFREDKKLREEYIRVLIEDIRFYELDKSPANLEKLEARIQEGYKFAPRAFVSKLDESYRASLTFQLNKIMDSLPKLKN